MNPKLMYLVDIKTRKNVMKEFYQDDYDRLKLIHSGGIEAYKVLAD